MRLVARIIAAAGLLLAFAAGTAPAQPRLTMQWEAMAERLVTQLAPEPGERILLVARPGQFDALIPPLRYALLRAGAVDLGVIDVIEEPYPDGWDGDLLAQGTAAARAVYREMLRDFDGAIMLPGARPDHAVYAALQDLLHEGIGRTIHFHWTQNGQRVPPAGAAHAVAGGHRRRLPARAARDRLFAALADGPASLRGRDAGCRGAGHVAAGHRHPVPHRGPAGEFRRRQCLEGAHRSRA